MAVQSRRGRILEAFCNQLKTITTANGYAHTVHKVSTDVRNWHELGSAETPALFVVDEATNYSYKPGLLKEADWTLAVFGVMKEKSQLQMEELVADIETCLESNMTLSFNGELGLINHIRVRGIATDNQLFSETDGTQLFRITVQVIYTQCRNDVR